MARNLQLSLTFEPLEEMWPQHPAALLLDLQALYFAGRAAAQAEQDVLPFYREESRLLLSESRGSADDLVAEVEYLDRAARRLELQGADVELWGPLRDSARILARRVANGVIYPETFLPEPARRRIAPRLRRMSMGSPFDVVLSIPAEYWTGGGLFLFLTAVEKKFNAVERIRTERAEEAANRAEAQARQREAEVREAMAQRQLAQLRAQMQHADSRVEGLEDPNAAFQLRKGELVVEERTAVETDALSP
jgi:hypothetical protein